MPHLRSGLTGAMVFGLGLLMGTEPPRAAAQASPSPDAGRPRKSVYGKLQLVDKRLNAIAMVSDTGQRLVWRFPQAVIEVAQQYKPGVPVIVIYRQIGPSDKR